MIAIDLGSNTIRAVKFDCATKTKLGEFERIVKTADNLVKSGGISDESIDRIVNAIDDMKKRFNFDDKIVAVATQALRSANNKEYVIEKIKDKTGIEFKVIEPIEEATFTAVAVEECLRRCNVENYNHFMLVDIGGGSTELIFKKRDIFATESIRLGIVTITQKYKTPEAIKIGVKQKVSQFRDFIEFVYSAYRKPKNFVASSGTPTTIAALKVGLDYESYNPELINGVRLTLDDLNYWEDKLMKMEMKKREKLVGVGRGDLIISGIYIFKEIFKLTGFKECIVCDDGVREGVAISACKEENQ